MGEDTFNDFLIALRPLYLKRLLEKSGWKEAVDSAGVRRLVSWGADAQIRGTSVVRWPRVEAIN